MRASEPVASTIFLAVISCVAPLGSVTLILPGPEILAKPRIISTLFFFSRNSTPLASLVTTLVLRAMIAGQSSENSFAHDAEFFGVLEVIVDVGVQKQILGGNAADVQAGSAPLVVLLDDRRFQAQLAGADRRHISARATADHHQVVFGSFCQDHTSK